MSRKKHEKRRDRQQEIQPHSAVTIALVFIAMLLVLAGCFVLGALLTAQVYKLTGTPPEPLETAISGVTGFLLFVVIALTVNAIRARKLRDNPNKDVHSQLLDAFAEIARGNFNVLLTPNENLPHNDITEAINKMARDLGSLETMRQDFISNVSHEIQSPLTSIGGFAALLKNDALPADDRRHYAEIIEAETKRLSSLSDNLLKLSALDSEKKPLNPEVFRLDKQLERVALMLEPQWAAKELNLEAELQKCGLYGDADLLSQVWVNLLHNAIKFTPVHGNIRITLTANDSAATVIIADTGAGIAPEDMLHVFERFYKADKSRDRALGGNGLGLSLAKKITEMSGGTISVRSEPGSGTVFTVVLPVSGTEPAE
ncbi:MAG: HAMP domain-containing histidine kinase [Oscillospiraceae bacterium]|jgi:signal transduction histidine kinase|nr:HAMP domain-containing histidine kinase [Oscillospiraceae bacterium]